MNPEPKQNVPIERDVKTNQSKEKKYGAAAIELENLRKSKAFRELGDMLYMD